MLQPGRSPGRATPGDAPATPAPKGKTSETSTAKSDEPAPGAAAEDAGQPGGLFGGMGMMLILPLLLFGLIILMNRSDKKRRQEVESKLKKGDRVVTRAGFIGKIVEVGEKNVRVEIAPGVVVRMVKTAIEGLADDDATKKDTSKKDDKSDSTQKDRKDGKKKK